MEATTLPSGVHISVIYDGNTHLAGVFSGVAWKTHQDGFSFEFVHISARGLYIL
jgi:hypothetical protein